jgi:hypothetical protein
MPQAAVRVLDDYAEKPGEIKAAFLQLYYLRHWEAANLVGEHFLRKNTFLPGHNREIENVLLFIAEQNGDVKRQLALLQDRFLLSGSTDVFQKLKTVAGERWPAVREQILALLQTRGDTTKTALLLASENDWEALTDLIEQKGALPLLQQYETKLLAEKKAFVKAQYIRFLSQYLDEHYGAPAAQHVRLRLAELLHKGETELVIEIIRELTARFPERMSLPAELAELFPKSKRKAI